MSSPPNSVSLPKKRPSLSVPSNQNAKRRKPSTGPSQLRQTSFPPPEGYPGAGSPASAGTPRYAFSRSPSVDSSVAPSQVNGTEGGGRGGRKRKRGGAASVFDDGRSATGGSVRGGKGGSPAEDANGEEEDEGPGDVEVDMEGGTKNDEEMQKKAREEMNMLVNAMSEEQRRRYEQYRSAKLRPHIVRKITNQTVSQSVPQSIVTTITGYTKVFISDLLDLARRVQEEWAQVADPNAIYPEEAYKKIYPPPQQPYNPAPSNIAGPRPIKVPQVEPKTVEEMCGTALGPLTPDHLREALRRYKKSQEVQGTGFVGLSLEGRETTAVRMGGKRLFR